MTKNGIDAGFAWGKNKQNATKSGINMDLKTQFIRLLGEKGYLCAAKNTIFQLWLVSTPSQ